MSTATLRGICKRWPLLVLSALAAVAASAQPANKETEQERRRQVLARFSDGRITVGELEDELNQQSHYLRVRYALPRQREAALEKRLSFELLAREARRRGYDRDPEVVEAVKKSAVQAMLKKQIDEKVTPDSVTQSELEQYYKANLSEFERPETRRVNRILLETREKAAALLAKAGEADMAGFRELAREHSLDQETRFRGGDLLYFDEKGIRRGEREPSIDPAIVEAAFKLRELGEVAAEPVESEGGWNVIKLTGHRPESKRPLKGVASKIRKRIWRENREKAIEKLVADLRKKYEPEVKPELVEPIVIETGRPGQNIRPGFPRERPKSPAPPAGDAAKR